jgi:hypothetical protein
MKKIAGILLGMGLACAANAALIAGDTIGIDFGATADTDAVTTWNQFSVGGDATTLGMADTDVVTLSSVNNTAGDAVSGVTFAVSNATGQIAWDFSGGTNGDPTEGSLITDASVYGDGLISNDQLSRPTVSGVDYFYFTFSGLDATGATTYDLTAGWDSNNDNFTADWTAGTETLRTTLADGYVDFTGLTADANGELAITVTGIEDAAHITVSALTLTAIPEPATIGMLGLGTVGLMVFRRRMM